MIIAGDIGGTKSNLALFTLKDKDYSFLHLATYHSKDHRDFKEIVLRFIEEAGQNPLDITAAAFAIAGPVSKGVVKATNLPWTIDSAILAESCRIPKVFLLNDLEANAWGIDTLTPDNLSILYPGQPHIGGNKGVISPGTGLGEAGIYWDGKDYFPFACEGGHADFAPRNELEIELCRYLLSKFGHASYERALSGPGIHNLYLFFKEVKKYEEPHWLVKKMKEEDPSKVITETALQNEVPICMETLNLFVSILGAEAGNFALKVMATGGIYLGGGIPPKIMPKLKEPFFKEAFIRKGRFSVMLEAIPLSLILDDKAALKGAAQFCRTVLQKRP